MATNYVRSPLTNLVQVGTTRVVVIPTNPATQIVLTTSAVRLLFITNVGEDTVTWGDSSVQAVSGGILFYSQGKQWDGVHRDWNQYFIADSIASAIAIQEFSDG